jgi:DNA-binding MarR family transcriptional regulator
VALRRHGNPCNQFICICIYPGMSGSLLPLPCFCANLRRASRALTQLYENALRPLGIRATQFTILQVLLRTGELSQGQLAEFLAMDSTSLTRTIATMQRHNWIKEHRGQDRRERWLSLTKSGEAQLGRVWPAWEKVQASLRDRIGDGNWNRFLSQTNELTNAVVNQGGLL